MRRVRILDVSHEEGGLLPVITLPAGRLCKFLGACSTLALCSKVQSPGAVGEWREVATSFHL